MALRKQKDQVTLPGGAIFELRRPDSLTPYARNPRKNDEAVSAVGRSIAEFGFRSPIEVDGDGEIVAGHTRLKAAIERGDEFVPVITWPDMRGDKSKAYRIAANKTGEIAEWDEGLLRDLLIELQDSEHSFNLAPLGFDEDELKALLAGSNGSSEIVEDEVPEPPEEPTTKVGDMWVFGEHRLLCGDATDSRTHEHLLAGEAPDVVLTDFPYGVGVDYESFTDDEKSVTALVDSIMPLLLRWPVVVMTTGIPLMWLYPRPSWMMAWVHPAGMGSGPWGFTQLNPILCYGKCPYLAKGLGRRPDALVLVADREGVEGHPTPKPMKVWSWLVERITPDPKALIFDPFLGSGTTLIAAEQLGRRCFGMEIEPRYRDVAIQRWENLTGGKAALLND